MWFFLSPLWGSSWPWLYHWWRADQPWSWTALRLLSVYSIYYQHFYRIAVFVSLSVPALLHEPTTTSHSSLVSWGSSAIVNIQQECNDSLMNYMINWIRLLWEIVITLSLETVKNTQQPQILWKYFQWINLRGSPMMDIKELNWY